MHMQCRKTFVLIQIMDIEAYRRLYCVIYKTKQKMDIEEYRRFNWVIPAYAWKNFTVSKHSGDNFFGSFCFHNKHCVIKILNEFLYEHFTLNNKRLFSNDSRNLFWSIEDFFKRLFEITCLKHLIEDERLHISHINWLKVVSFSRVLHNIITYDTKHRIQLLKTILNILIEEEINISSNPSMYIQVSIIDENLQNDDKDRFCTIKELRDKLGKQSTSSLTTLQLYILTVIKLSRLMYMNNLTRALVDVSNKCNTDKTKLCYKVHIKDEQTEIDNQEDVYFYELKPVCVDLKARKSKVANEILNFFLRRNTRIIPPSNAELEISTETDEARNYTVCLSGALVKPSEGDENVLKELKFPIRNNVIPDQSVTVFPINGSNDTLSRVGTGERSIETILQRFSSNSPPTKRETMAHELLRLCTMHDLPNPGKVSFFRLAQAGFYYAGNNDEVVCFLCDKRKGGWNADNDPIQVHREMSPDCPFFHDSSINIPVLYAEDLASRNLLAKDSSSVPVAGHERDRRNEPDVAGNIDSGTGMLSNSTRSHGASDGSTSTGTRESDNVSGSSRGLSGGNNNVGTESGYGTSSRHETRAQNFAVSSQARNKAVLKYPNYKDFEKRLESYSNWPSHLRQNPRDLSQCGFFHSGNQDGVRCFRCGIGLRNWDKIDNPWVEHARWSPECPFILSVKGQAFVDMVQEAARLAEMEQEALRERNAASNTIDSPQQSLASTSTASVERNHEKTRSNLSSKQASPQQSLASTSTASVERNHENTRPNLSSRQANADTEVQSSPVDQNESAQSVTSSTIKKKKKRKQKKEKKKAAAVPDDVEMESETNSDPEEPGGATGSTLHTDKTQNGSHDKTAKILENTDNNDTEALKRQIKEMKDLTICKICLEEKVSVVFLPCGHLVACGQCSRKLRKCPICRQFIKNTVRTQI